MIDTVKEFLRVPVIPIPMTRRFKAVLTARACTCKLSTSFLCAIVWKPHKLKYLLSAHAHRSTQCLYRLQDTDKQESVHERSTQTARRQTTQRLRALYRSISQWQTAAKLKNARKSTHGQEILNRYNNTIPYNKQVYVTTHEIILSAATMYKATYYFCTAKISFAITVASKERKLSSIKFSRNFTLLVAILFL